jgi:monoamine oxidase
MKKQIVFIFMFLSTLYSTPNLYSQEGLTMKKVVIIGAGLAGLTTGYRLYKKGFDVHVYEARNRVGGRILSALVNGHIAELGGENIADGGSCENINQLLQEFGLELFRSESSFNVFFHYENMLFPKNDLIKKQNLNLETLKGQLYTIKQTSISMQDILNQLKLDEPLKKCLNVSLAGYEGASADKLSSSYIETLYYMIKGGLSAAHQGNTTAFARVKEGNGKLPEALAARLGNRVHMKMPVASITKNSQNQYILMFKNGSTTTADILILAIPCPIYNDILFDEKVIHADRLSKIRSIHNGSNAKIIVPISGNFSTSNIFMNDHMGVFTFVDGIITLYFTGQSSQFEPDSIAQRYAQERPLLMCGFDQTSLPKQEPIIAWDELFASYSVPVGYSWPLDPFAKGTYSYIGVGQEELFTMLQEHDGFVTKTLFAPIDHQLYFAGEHASTLFDVQGTMEAACQSGNLVADMIEKIHLFS